MKFKKGSRRPVLEYEHDLVVHWKKNKTFEKSIANRPETEGYVFYDGPPFITGTPHHGTLLTSIVKDVVPRYWTMKGKRVERVWGWDCHGLPAEVFTEKKLGIKDRRDIGTKVSLEDYITTCRSNMVQTGSLWEDTIDRIGRWVDFQGAYKTMDKDYMESVWWAFKTLYEDKKIYEGEKVLLYCIRDATPISKAEVAMDNSYQDVTDPSVFVKLKLKDSNAYLLAWTTTPWTLPANTAAAVNKKFEYAEVKVGDEVYILAAALLDKVLTDEKHNVVPYTLIRKFKGTELIGKSYEPLFEDQGQNAHQIWNADYVNLDDGTGVVHIAPAYGEEDYLLAKMNKIPIVSNIDDSGIYLSGQWVGEQVWEINKQIAKRLFEQKIVWKIDYITHSYPHCHRCGTKLMYRAHPSWFMNIADQREQMLEENAKIDWFPKHIKQGRFAKTVQTAPDWNISRDRFWATAMPVWKGKDRSGKTHIKVVGSYQELKDLSGVELEDYHRPWIDDVTFEINDVKYTRVDKVLDCWFESGSMPFAQYHYPFENVDKFEKNFPGDFIVEYVPQVRAWFYYLHAISIGLYGQPAFQTALVHGTIAGNDGRKMSKSFGNYTDPNELMDKYSADALRFLFLSSPLLSGEDFTLQDKEVADINRKLAMIWNMYDFFTLYADVDNWSWDSNMGDPSSELVNPLDQWIVSRIHQLSKEIDTHMMNYDIPNAIKPILPFIDDASNWYVRRSRKRFWKSDNDDDKASAYKTLHYVLTQLSIIMAPFTPFLAEELYIKLTGGESVHLLDWPGPGHINELVIKDMAYTREVITAGLSIRADAAIKVRQPLNKATVMDGFEIGAPKPLNHEFLEIIRDELNLKSIELQTKNNNSKKSSSKIIELDTKITAELYKEGLMREVIRNVQQARKLAGLDVADRINLTIESDSKAVKQLLDSESLVDIISQETLATSVNTTEDNSTYSKSVKVDSHELHISLSKA
ncbi:MAG: isoleucine--tRNA ligase [Candidatus Saccharimonadales bacterium]